ncbi:MAG: hypothetical protein RLZZ519_656, partial [Bacteroidota bacterium]
MLAIPARNTVLRRSEHVFHLDIEIALLADDAGQNHVLAVER